MGIQCSYAGVSSTTLHHPFMKWKDGLKAPSHVREVAPLFPLFLATNKLEEIEGDEMTVLGDNLFLMRKRKEEKNTEEME